MIVLNLHFVLISFLIITFINICASTMFYVVLKLHPSTFMYIGGLVFTKFSFYSSLRFYLLQRLHFCDVLTVSSIF